MYERLQHEDPAVRIQAAVEAAENRDRESVSLLIDRLEDPNADVRFFSWIALRKITGTSHGWNYYDPPEKRSQAVERWRQWLSNTSKVVHEKGTGAE